MRETQERRPTAGAEPPQVMSIGTHELGDAILAGEAVQQKLRDAVLRNEKFRAVLEYDPEGRSYFFIQFAGQGTPSEGKGIEAERQFKDFLAGRLNMLDLVIADMRQSLLEKGGHERLENQGDKT